MYWNEPEAQLVQAKAQNATRSSNSDSFVYFLMAFDDFLMRTFFAATLLWPFHFLPFLVASLADASSSSLTDQQLHNYQASTEIHVKSNEGNGQNE